MHSEVREIEDMANSKEHLSLEDLTNAIVLPSWKADLRTIKDVSWTWRWFENSVKYIEWNATINDWIKIKIKLKFVKKDGEYLFLWISWNAVK